MTLLPSYRHVNHGGGKQTCGDCTEPLLTSRVPNLELDPFSIKLNGSDFKINSARVKNDLVNTERNF